MGKSRIGMVCRIDQPQNISGHDIRRITQDDKERIAAAMLDAYMGTVDQQEDTFEEALKEVENIFNNMYGPLISEASFMIEKENEVASIILISFFEESPLIVEVFTGKKHYKQGMASALIKASMNELLALGYDRLTLYVKEENADAIKLYTKLGFRAAEK
jgi:predicted GNAT family acetyltransferase